MIGIITDNPTTWFGYGLMPFLAIILMYIQMTSGKALNSAYILIVAFLFYAIGITIIYLYKNSLHYQMLYKLFTGRKPIVRDEFEEGLADATNEKMATLSKSTGFWGITFMLFAIWIFSTGTQYAIDNSMWEHVAVRNMFSFASVLKTIQFIVAGISMAGATYVFLRFYWNGGYDFKNDEYAEYAKKNATLLSIGALAFQPILMAVVLFFAPKASVSYMVYIGVALAIVFTFIGCHLLYTFLKSKSNNMLKYAFVLVILAFSFFAVSQQQNFSTANEETFALKEHQYEQIELARAAESAGPVVIDGSQIYKTRCSACHKFDVAQATAPAYDDVIPKYDGKMDALVEFIYNPQPRGNLDPSGNKYSPMPNQGLNKKEAEAVAKYIAEEVAKSKK